MKWISVKKELPAVDKKVLVSCETKKGIKNINIAYMDNNRFLHGMGSMSGVTAWMPLLEPYAEGDEK